MKATGTIINKRNNIIETTINLEQNTRSIKENKELLLEPE